MRMCAVVLSTSLLLLVGACGSDAEPGGVEPSGGDATSGAPATSGLKVCDLVSDETVDRLQKASIDPQPAPRETLRQGLETFVECQVIRGVELGFAVRAVDGGPTLDEQLASGTDAPAEELPDVGDEAWISSNSYDGVRIGARVGSQELIVDSNYQDDDEDYGRDTVIALTKEVAANLGDDRPAPVVLPEACPAPTVPIRRTGRTRKTPWRSGGFAHGRLVRERGLEPPRT